MSTERGTFETLIGELTNLLAPLTGLTTSAGPVILRELGIVLTDAQAVQIAPTLSVSTTGSGQLLGLEFQLDGAIQSGNSGAVVDKGLAAVDKIATLISGFDQLKSALAGLGLPDAGPIVANFPELLFNYLLANYLGRNPGVNPLLGFGGVLVRTDHNVGVFDPAKPFFTTNSFHFDRIGGWIREPSVQLADLYDWNTAGFDGKKILAILDRAAADLGLPALYDPTAPTPSLDLIFADLTPRMDAPRGIALRLHQGLSKGKIELDRQQGTLVLGLDADLNPDTNLVFRPGKITLEPPDATKFVGRIAADYSYKRESADPLVLLSVGGGNGISVEEVTASVGLDVQENGAADLKIGAAFKRGRARLGADKQDGFISKILSGLKLESNFDVGVSFSARDGLRFDGASALEIQLASHIGLGPIEIVALKLSVGVDGPKFPLAVTTDIKASLGPLTAVIEGIGLKVDLSLVSDRGGNLGVLDFKPGIQPPKGVGLSLDAGVVKGGGYLYFDFDREEYAGALELVFAGFLELKAVGLITTKLPDGTRGFSLLIIITAEFPTPLQLSFGFTLIGVGGLIGLNRTMRLEVLAEGVRTGSINSVMFPKDVVANAPRIISDLRAIFPPAEGRFLIGPMAKLGWGTPTLVSLSLGVIIEIPPGNVVILGILRIALPADELAVVVLQVNFVGAFEPEKKRLWFFAELFDSRIVFITLTGGLGVLISFGDDANFVLTVGGFHPRFTPPAMPFPAPQRLAINIINESFARIRVEGYFAVTTNTVQFGVLAESMFGFDEFNVSGHFQFDALFQFSPFHFEISGSAHFSIKVFGAGLYGIGVSFQLEGTTPWRVRGRGSISILFFDIDVDFDITWGDRPDTTLPPAAVMPTLLGEFAKPSCWRTELPAGSNLLVTLRPLEAGEAGKVLHPAGTLHVSQKRVPLDLTITKVGNQKVSDVNRVRLELQPGSGLTKNADLPELFAPAQFRDFDDAGRLSQPAFQPEHGGVELTGGGGLFKTHSALKRSTRYELILLDTGYRRNQIGFYGLHAGLLAHWIKGGSAARSDLSRARRAELLPHGDRIRAGPETYAVAFVENNKAMNSQAAQFASHAKADDFLRDHVRENPSDAGRLHVIPQFEVTL